MALPSGGPSGSPIFICGSAACLHDDLERARAIYPDAPVIAVNGASKLVDADHVYSKHPERFITYRWLEAQRFRFGDVTVHADVKAASRPDCVDEWWDGIWGGGGSAWDARKLAVRLGYEAVILCGVPMIAGPHVPQVQLGSFMHREDIVKEFRDQIEADAKWHKGATSMSGWTRDLLGSP